MIKSLLDIEETLFDHLNRDLGLNPTREEIEKMKKQVNCHICNGPLSIQSEDKHGNLLPNVRDHVSNYWDYIFMPKNYLLLFFSF